MRKASGGTDEDHGTEDSGTPTATDDGGGASSSSEGESADERPLVTVHGAPPRARRASTLAVIVYGGLFVVFAVSAALCYYIGEMQAVGPSSTVLAVRGAYRLAAVAATLSKEIGPEVAVSWLNRNSRGIVFSGTRRRRRDGTVLPYARCFPSLSGASSTVVLSGAAGSNASSGVSAASADNATTDRTLRLGSDDEDSARSVRDAGYLSDDPSVLRQAPETYREAQVALARLMPNGERGAFSLTLLQRIVSLPCGAGNTLWRVAEQLNRPVVHLGGGGSSNSPASVASRLDSSLSAALEYVTVAMPDDEGIGFLVAASVPTTLMTTIESRRWQSASIEICGIVACFLLLAFIGVELLYATTLPSVSLDGQDESMTTASMAQSMGDDGTTNHHPLAQLTTRFERPVRRPLLFAGSVVVGVLAALNAIACGATTWRTTAEIQRAVATELTLTRAEILHLALASMEARSSDVAAGKTKAARQQPLCLFLAAVARWQSRHDAAVDASGKPTAVPPVPLSNGDATGPDEVSWMSLVGVTSKTGGASPSSSSATVLCTYQGGAVLPTNRTPPTWALDRLRDAQPVTFTVSADMSTMGIAAWFRRRTWAADRTVAPAWLSDGTLQDRQDDYVGVVEALPSVPSGGDASGTPAEFQPTIAVIVVAAVLAALLCLQGTAVNRVTHSPQLAAWIKDWFTTYELRTWYGLSASVAVAIVALVHSATIVAAIDTSTAFLHRASSDMLTAPILQELLAVSRGADRVNPNRPAPPSGLDPISRRRRVEMETIAADRWLGATSTLVSSFGRYMTFWHTSPLADTRRKAKRCSAGVATLSTDSDCLLTDAPAACAAPHFYDHDGLQGSPATISNSPMVPHFDALGGAQVLTFRSGFDEALWGTIPPASTLNDEGPSEADDPIAAPSGGPEGSVAIALVTNLATFLGNDRATFIVWTIGVCVPIASIALLLSMSTRLFDYAPRRGVGYRRAVVALTACVGVVAMVLVPLCVVFPARAAFAFRTILTVRSELRDSADWSAEAIVARVIPLISMQNQQRSFSLRDVTDRLLPHVPISDTDTLLALAAGPPLTAAATPLREALLNDPSARLAVNILKYHAAFDRVGSGGATPNASSLSDIQRWASMTMVHPGAMLVGLVQSFHDRGQQASCSNRFAMSIALNGVLLPPAAAMTTTASRTDPSVAAIDGVVGAVLLASANDSSTAAAIVSGQAALVQSSDNECGVVCAGFVSAQLRQSVLASDAPRDRESMVEVALPTGDGPSSRMAAFPASVAATFGSDVMVLRGAIATRRFLQPSTMLAGTSITAASSASSSTSTTNNQLMSVSVFLAARPANSLIHPFTKDALERMAHLTTSQPILYCFAGSLFLTLLTVMLWCAFETANWQIRPEQTRLISVALRQSGALDATEPVGVRRKHVLGIILMAVPLVLLATVALIELQDIRDVALTSYLDGFRAAVVFRVSTATQWTASQAITGLLSVPSGAFDLTSASGQVGSVRSPLDLLDSSQTGDATSTATVAMTSAWTAALTAVVQASSTVGIAFLGRGATGVAASPPSATPGSVSATIVERNNGAFGPTWSVTSQDPVSKRTAVSIETALRKTAVALTDTMSVVWQTEVSAMASLDNSWLELLASTPASSTDARPLLSAYLGNLTLLQDVATLSATSLSQSFLVTRSDATARRVRATAVHYARSAAAFAQRVLDCLHVANRGALPAAAVQAARQIAAVTKVRYLATEMLRGSGEAVLTTANDATSAGAAGTVDSASAVDALASILRAAAALANVGADSTTNASAHVDLLGRSATLLRYAAGITGQCRGSMRENEWLGRAAESITVLQDIASSEQLLTIRTGPAFWMAIGTCVSIAIASTMSTLTQHREYATPYRRRARSVATLMICFAVGTLFAVGVYARFGDAIALLRQHRPSIEEGGSQLKHASLCGAQLELMSVAVATALLRPYDDALTTEAVGQLLVARQCIVSLAAFRPDFGNVALDILKALDVDSLAATFEQGGATYVAMRASTTTSTLPSLTDSLQDSQLVMPSFATDAVRLMLVDLAVSASVEPFLLRGSPQSLSGMSADTSALLPAQMSELGGAVELILTTVLSVNRSGAYSQFSASALSAAIASGGAALPASVHKLSAAAARIGHLASAGGAASALLWANAAVTRADGLIATGRGPTTGSSSFAAAAADSARASLVASNAASAALADESLRPTTAAGGATFLSDLSTGSLTRLAVATAVATRMANELISTASDIAANTSFPVACPAQAGGIPTPTSAIWKQMRSFLPQC